jgi:L-ascorbate metabolism protein UlaG (beta-lactamase superfamily)
MTDMTNKFRFLGFSAFEIVTTKGVRILIDPYLDRNPVSPVKHDAFDKVDLVIVSHAAFDHLGEAAEIAVRYGSKVVCGGDTKAILAERGVPAGQMVETVWGLMVQACGIRIRPVKSEHRSAGKLKDGTVTSALPLGFVIWLEDGTRVYNASDTALFSDLKLIGGIHRPHVGLMNATIENDFDFLPEFLTGEMTAYEAALASAWLGLDLAVACHYTKRDCEDIREFIGTLEAWRAEGKTKTRPFAPEPGEVFEYSAPEGGKTDRKGMSNDVGL